MRIRSTALAPLVLALACSPSPGTPAARAGELRALATDSGHTWLMNLTCDPDGGTHPDPPAACAALTVSGWDLLAAGSPDPSCPKNAEPVWVTTWGRGPSGTFRDAYRFSSLCAAESATGGVLRFM